MADIDVQVADILDRVKILEEKVQVQQTELDLFRRTFVRRGSNIALKLTQSNLYVGATGGQGEVNTATPGQPPRQNAGADETFEVALLK